MSAQRQGFLLGIGSNIDPFSNFSKIFDALLNEFDCLEVSRVLHIPPVGMNSQHYFLNATAFIETNMSQSALKSICNRIEIELGRDRDDPNSKHKDRPADIDILQHLRIPNDLSIPARAITDEYFLYPLLDELFCYLADKNHMQPIQEGTNIQVGDLTFGQSATTIHRNCDAGEKVIR